MAAGRKKQQGSNRAAAAPPEKESGKGKGNEKAARGDGKELEREKQRRRGEEKEVREEVQEPAKEKQKQKGKGKGDKEVREDGREKEKQQGKEEAAAKSVGQQFFKIFFPGQSAERLKIPASFHQHLMEQSAGLVSLKGPSGNTWQAVLTSDSEGLWFGHGWKEFVMDHSVKQGHFLVFTYDGLSQFSVTVFGPLGTVDPLALVAKPSNDIVIKIEDDEELQGDMDAGGTSEPSVLPPEEGNGITRKRARGVNDVSADGNAPKRHSSVTNKVLPPEEGNGKRPRVNDYISADGNGSKRHSSVAKKTEKKIPEANAGTSKDASTIVNTDKDGNASKRYSSVTKKAEKKIPEANAGTSKDGSTIINTDKDGNASKRNSNVTKKAEKKIPEANAGTSKDASTIVNTDKDDNASKRNSNVTKKAEKKIPEANASTSKDASTIVNTNKDAPFSLLDESMSFNKTLVREKNMPKLGKFLVRRARQPMVISQRRAVTQEEKDHALRRAKEFKSKNPFAVQTMMESYVYVGFFMNITCEFVRESLPRTNKKMTLWDPLGKPWVVNYVYYSDRSVASFSGGWGKFALGNNLEKFDVCIFELFKEDNIKVHIYRVVPEITPLLRASSKD